MRVDYGVIIVDGSGNPVGPSAPGGAATDVSDRAARLLGVVDTELPAAAALADAAANPTVPGVGSFPHVWTGATYYRQLAANGTGDASAGQGFPSTSLMVAITGSAYDKLRTPKVFKAQSAVSIAAEATVWTPAAGKKFRLMGMTIACSVAGDVTFRDNTAGTIIAVLTCQAGVSISLSPAFGNGILSAAANNVLTATGPAASTLSGTIFGTEE